MTERHVVIIGAGAAGVAAARILSSHADVRVTLVARTGETAYTRMLIKSVAFGSTPAELVATALPSVEVIADTAIRIDAPSKVVALASGRTIDFDALLVATGSRPRPLPAEIVGTATTSARVTVLHTLDDALRVRDVLSGLAPSARVAIYGGGVIGSESASSLRDDGREVTLIARSAVPGLATFGAPVAERVARAHEERVRTRFGRSLTAVDHRDGALLLTLDDGSVEAADLLLVALGTIPSGPWPWQDGVDVDLRLRVAPGVYAAGGTAWHRDALRGNWRIDHWDDAAAQGAHAAQAVLHDLTGADDPGAYEPHSPYLAMVHGRAIAGAGLLVGDEEHVAADSGLAVVHRVAHVAVGVSGIDAVGAVYQWANDPCSPPLPADSSTSALGST
ncbi:NAD(P)/FAD-dependent oxidoreductase [Microbacterium sp. H1-D42]|uniref:FAD-dependent oxidoreductase n=1 Tax=Microbacterium sp. H1-D42 TaxID=2925844 RepID=UPI001F53B538|nr:NAD(P)/FAD-dependent oxidoreductase [Microbacterium sp. H1-D42]UNK70851.1 NAD(P)/FAD-dependent oxidoreductase [Microbacterium sp. H1-D42]